MEARSVVVLVTCVIVGVVTEDGDRGAAVRNVFREMLHIQPPMTSDIPKPPAPPRHMLELYHRYLRKGAPYGAATTVRNILPLYITGGDDLLFNVSSVQGREAVRLAQLQLNRRRLPQRHALTRRLLPSPFRVKLYRSGPGRLSSLTSVPVSGVLQASWVSVDVTEALRELLLDNRPSRRLLTVRFEAPGGKHIAASHFLRGVPDKEHAFLVLFSEDSDEGDVAKDGGAPPSKPPVHTHALVQRLRKHQLPLLEDQEDNNPPLIPTVEGKRTRKMSTKDHSRSELLNLSKRIALDDFVTSYNVTADITGTLLRNTRSIMDNQLQDVEGEEYSLNEYTSLVDSTISQGTDLPTTRGSSRTPDKGKKGKRKKGKKRKQVSITDLWNSSNNSSVPGACAVRRLTVNFAEIGWGSWIISPDKFEANYCTGSCRYPLTKAQRPSNHAALQSLVHALGHHPLVPAPACVPHHMSAVTLLYFDQALNVVLKNYPSMVVDSCACR